MALTGAAGVTRYTFETIHEVIDHGNVQNRYEWIITVQLVQTQAQQGSDWTNTVQFALTVGEFFRNIKSYQFNGTDAAELLTF